MELIGREYQARQLRQYIERGMSCQVIGPTGSGKTTLIQAVVETLPENFRITRLTVQDYTSEAAFWQALWAGFGRSEAAPPTTSRLAEVLGTWNRQGITTVVCLDDTDAVADQLAVLSPDFFFDLRTLATEAKVVFVAAARQPLSALLPSSRIGSNFFSYFALLQLGAINVDEAMRFFDGEKVVLSAEDEQLLRGAKAYFPAQLSKIAEDRRAGKSFGTSLQETRTL